MVFFKSIVAVFLLAGAFAKACTKAGAPAAEKAIIRSSEPAVERSIYHNTESAIERGVSRGLSRSGIGNNDSAGANDQNDNDDDMSHAEKLQRRKPD